MTELLLIIIIVLVSANTLILIFKKTNTDIKPQLKEIEDSMIRTDSGIERNEKSIRDEFQRNRTEMNEITKTNREELTKTLNFLILPAQDEQPDLWVISILVME